MGGWQVLVQAQGGHLGDALWTARLESSQVTACLGLTTSQPKEA